MKLFTHDYQDSKVALCPPALVGIHIVLHVAAVSHISFGSVSDTDSKRMCPSTITQRFYFHFFFCEESKKSVLLEFPHKVLMLLYYTSSGRYCRMLQSYESLFLKSYIENCRRRFWEVRKCVLKNDWSLLQQFIPSFYRIVLCKTWLERYCVPNEISPT